MDTEFLEKFCSENHPDVAIFCVPKAATPALATKLHSYGVKIIGISAIMT